MMTALRFLFVSTLLSWLNLIAGQSPFEFGSLNPELTLSNDDKAVMNVSRQSENETFPYQNERLPKDIVPESYHLWLKFKSNEKTEFFGKVKIRVKCVHPTRYIILHSRKLNFSSYHLNKRDSSKPIELLPMKTNLKYDQILFETNSSLVSGETYELTIAYSGQMSAPRSKLLGMFNLEYYSAKAGRKKTIVFSSLNLDGARTVLPCFNEPSFKSHFEISVEHEENLRALTNTPLVKRVPAGHGMVKSTFEPTVKMSCYHLAFGLSDFANVTTTTKRGTKIIIWATEEAIVDESSYLGLVSTSVTTMEEYTGINYPYSELNVFAIPTEGYVFEGFGLLLIADKSAVQNSTKLDRWSELNHRTLIPNEISYIWFGDLVTIKYWDEFWLYQGLANFFKYHILEQYNKAYKQEMLFNERTNAVFIKDSQETSIPMNSKKAVTMTSFSKLLAIYNGKSSMVFYMLQQLLGKNKFREGIRIYLQKYKYGNANAAELWEIFQSLSPSFDVKTVMHGWEYQAGYPVIYIKYADKDSKGNKVYTASQSRYISGLSPDDPKYQAKYSNYSWYIPLWYRDSSDPGKVEMIWMNKTSVNITVPGCSKWIKANAGQAGIYQVIYERDMIENFANQLKLHHKVLPVSDRHGLLRDAYVFRRIDKWQSDTISPFLKLSTYLMKERSFTPLEISVYELGLLVEKTRFRPRIFVSLKKYISSLFKQTLLDNTWDDPVFKREMFADVFNLLASIGEPAAVKKGLQMVDNWMNTGSFVDLYLRQSAYEIAAREGSRKHWDFLYDQYKRIADLDETATDEQKNEREKRLAGLSATKSIQTIHKWLNDTYLESVSNKTDIWEKMAQVSRFSPGREKAWKYFKTNFDAIVKRDARVNGNKTISLLGFARYFDKQTELDEVETFARSKQKLFTLQATNATLETIRGNIKWMKKHEQHIKDFLTGELHK